MQLPTNYVFWVEYPFNWTTFICVAIHIEPLKRYSTQKLKFVESYIFISYLSRCFSFFSKMFLHLPAAFPAKKCGSGGQYSGLQWPVFWAPKSSIQSSEASILGSKASTLSSMASTLAPWTVLWLQGQYLKLRTRIMMGSS